jgi:hypothetical protein
MLFLLSFIQKKIFVKQCIILRNQKIIYENLVNFEITFDSICLDKNNFYLKRFNLNLIIIYLNFWMTFNYFEIIIYFKK